MLKRLIVFVSILSILIIPFSFTHKVEAANFTLMSDVMTRLNTSTASNHTITFTLASTWDASETVTVDFDDGFDTTGFLNSEPEDFDITWAGTDKTIVANGGCAADSIEITTVNTTTDTFTFTLCAGSTSSGGTDAVVIEIGTNATFGTPGDDQIDNPGSSGSKTITLGGTIGDSGQLAVAILSGDQVTVSATVDPTITSTLSSSTCSLGTLSNSAINFCSYTNTVTTNAGSGYSSTIIEDGNLRDGGNDIDDVADTDVDEGSEEYGVSSNDTTGSQDIIDSTGCDDSGISEDATAITGTAQEYADNTGPVSSEVTTVCHLASITGTTPSGIYQHIVTHITTGTF